MKKNLWMTLLLAAVLVMFTGCGKDEADPEETQETTKVAESMEEEEMAGVFENDLVKVRLQEGWEVYDDGLDMGMMRIRKKGDTDGTGPAIYFVFHGEMAGKSPCGVDPREEVAKFAQEYEGSEMAEVVYNGITYYKTVYDYGGPQVMMQTKLDGSCIHVKLAGEGAVEDPDIQEMLATVSYKMPETETQEY